MKLIKQLAHRGRQSAACTAQYTVVLGSDTYAFRGAFGGSLGVRGGGRHRTQRPVFADTCQTVCSESWQFEIGLEQIVSGVKKRNPKKLIIYDELIERV